MRGLLIFICFIIGIGYGDCKVTNTKIDRTIDVSQHIVKVQMDITYVDDAASLRVYQVALMKEQEVFLSMMKATFHGQPCQVQPSNEIPVNPDYVLYNVLMNESTLVAVGEAGNLKITMHYTHALLPYPKELNQGDKQFVKYYDADVVPSPYLTTKQSTVIKCPSADILSFSSIQQPVKKNGARLTYGPYTGSGPFASSYGSLKLHFRNHSPFLTLTNVVKEIEVSMWGRVSVEEIYDLTNTGATLIGGFSRLDYTQQSKGPILNAFTALLPKEAENVYYRDIIGNITTSQMRRPNPSKRSRELILTPRFPIMGGWKTQWYMGYTLPSASVMVQSKPREYALQIDLSTPIKDATVDALTVKVILPEGATNIHLDLPFPVESQSETTRHTYLDSALYGRPVVVFAKSNLIPLHNVPFMVRFEFDPVMMWHEPLLLVGAFFVIFIACIVALRINISLTLPTKTGIKRD